MTDDKDYTYMRVALEEANLALQKDEVPIGSVLVDPQSGAIIARAHNLTITNADPTAHAEILAIRAACLAASAQRIPEYDLYVTLESCAMCAGAISFARIRRLVYGAPDPKGGGVDHGGKLYSQPTCHHRPDVVSGILADECGQMLKDFFKEKRAKR